MTNVEQGRYFAAPLFYSRAVATNQSNQNVKRIQASKVGGKMRRQRSESSSLAPGVYAIVDSMGSLKLTSVFQAPRKCRELLFFSRVDRRFATAGARFSKPCVTPSAIARIPRAPVSILRKGEIKLKKKIFRRNRDDCKYRIWLIVTIHRSVIYYLSDWYNIIPWQR